MEEFEIMFNLYDEEAIIYQDKDGSFFWIIDGQKSKRNYPSFDRITDILYKNGFRF